MKLTGFRQKGKYTLLFAFFSCLFIIINLLHKYNLLSYRAYQLVLETFTITVLIFAIIFCLILNSRTNIRFFNMILCLALICRLTGIFIRYSIQTQISQPGSFFLFFTYSGIFGFYLLLTGSFSFIKKNLKKTMPPVKFWYFVPFFISAISFLLLFYKIPLNQFMAFTSILFFISLMLYKILRLQFYISGLFFFGLILICFFDTGHYLLVLLQKQHFSYLIYPFVTTGFIFLPLGMQQYR